MASNTAAWLTTKETPRLEIKPAPYPSPTQNEIIVKNGAVAINPVDCALQDLGNDLFPWIKYPFILGSDLAGEVVEIGSSVSKFKVGDRVLGLAVGADPDSNNAADNAFQKYTAVRENLASRIPERLSYEEAAVLPLCLATAASGLFGKDSLALQLPTIPPQAPTGKAILIWGGSTSVGSNAIQLAVAAGYEVITTASPKNFDYVKRLGASKVFDYKKKTVVREMIHVLENKTMAGAMAIGEGSLFPCMDILYRSTGSKFVANVSVAGPPKSNFFLTCLNTMCWNISLWVKTRFRGVEQKFVWGSGLKTTELADVIFGDFLPKALEAQQYIIAPEPHVLGKGLEYVQSGLDVLKEGVSARKLVVSL
ncbi:alcohol dehydrogenase, putative [Paecilomyces variotii No. 5]|uniref:Alcohol dehydrogenase, putative n=1 Tax=Byssochlamys spectabilis (strain No. 5 / NBRC 109023) TaxID=1356009 RepID=V5G5E4_BYSSN|nr:alcohol dehydrogenase, putative [Paecilomyces variotii No. 5]